MDMFMQVGSRTTVHRALRAASKQQMKEASGGRAAAQRATSKVTTGAQVTARRMGRASKRGTEGGIFADAVSDGADAADAADSATDSATDGQLNIQGTNTGFAAFISQLASGKDPGDNNQAKEMVQQLIVRLLQEQTHEEGQKNNCTRDTKAVEKLVEDRGQELTGLESMVTHKENEKETAEREVQELEENQQKLSSLREEVIGQRKTEKEDYEKKAEDRKLTIKVLKQAAKILTHFYDSLDRTSASADDLLQVANQTIPDAPPEPDTWTSGQSTRKTIASGAAVSMIEKVIEDVERERKTADE